MHRGFPLLLKLQEGPLVVDQPEDNLDNRHIADTIAPALLEDKRGRQIAFTSHNANLVVLTDAEQIALFDSDGSTGVCGRTRLSMHKRFVDHGACDSDIGWWAGGVAVAVPEVWCGQPLTWLADSRPCPTSLRSTSGENAYSSLSNQLGPTRTRMPSVPMKTESGRRYSGGPATPLRPRLVLATTRSVARWIPSRMSPSDL